MERKRLKKPEPITKRQKSTRPKPKIIIAKPVIPLPKTQPAQGIDGSFLNASDPALLQAVLTEMEEELQLREGLVTARTELPEPRPLRTEEWATRDFALVQRWRYRKLAELTDNPKLIQELYANDPIRFICHWCDIYEPRNAGKGDKTPTRMPFILFKRQEELLMFYHACVVEEGKGLVEKSRDMGATWAGVAYSVWMWLFHPGSAIGWGSAKADKLDLIGEPGSIFEKVRLLIRGLPKIFLPKKLNDDDHLLHQRIINPDNGSTIVGEIGDNIGRGGRTRLYFVDEAAWIPRAELIEASLSENTRVRIDISSVSSPGTVFHRSREAGVEWSPGQPIEKVRHNVFIMDWSDHPEKTPEWNAQRKASMETRGLGHVYAREIGRNYAATVEGSIIKPEWIEAAFDAHVKLNLEGAFKTGPRFAGLDVGDGGLDANALTIREHRVLSRVRQWKDRDTGVTTREAVNDCAPYLPLELHYDCIGVGAGVKAEANRLKEDGLIPASLKILPWHAGAPVLRPFENIIPNDISTPLNKDFFANLKAQAWWNLRQCFYNVWLIISQTAPVADFKVEQLISIDTKACDRTLLHRFRDELSQAKLATSTRMKTGVDKTPNNMPSPNMADSAVIAFWPNELTDPNLAITGGFGGVFFGPSIIYG